MASNPPEHFPPARVIPPLNPPHRQTIILLHGRGLSWSTFGVDLLSTEFHAFYPLDPATASMIEGEGNLKQRAVPLRTLQTRYPHAKFIFPLAPRGRATIYARSMIHQWFDGWHLAPPVSPESEDESSEDGLLESSSEVYAAFDIGTNSEDGFEPNSGAQTQSQKAHMHQNQHQHHQKHDKQNHNKLQQQKHHHHHHHHQRRREAQEEWRSIPGLQETITYLHNLIRQEAALLNGSPSSTASSDNTTCNPQHGTQNIVLGGLSQGCAASLAALLLWDGEALGGYWGMCGWLVFESALRGVVNAGSRGGSRGGSGGERGSKAGEEVEFDPFERSEDYDDGEGEEEGIEMSVEAKMVRALKEELEWGTTTRGTSSMARPKVFDTPVFLGHGIEDDKVPVGRGKEASECLRAAGIEVEWKAYGGLGHWYSPQMLTDMVSFTTPLSGW